MKGLVKRSNSSRSVVQTPHSCQADRPRAIGPSYSSSSSSFRLCQRPGRGARLACEADLSGRHNNSSASSDRLSSNPATRNDGPPASLREALRAGVLEFWSTAQVLGEMVRLCQLSVSDPRPVSMRPRTHINQKGRVSRDRG
jgi:hypothetical protein